MPGNIISRMFQTPTQEPLKTDPVAFASNALLGSASFQQYNPDDLLTRKGYKVYKKMMTDEQVKAVVRFHRDAVTGREWSFVDDIRLSEEENNWRRLLFTHIIHRMPGSFKTRLDMVMSSIYNGFSLTEKVFELFDFEGKQWAGIESLKLKPFDTFFFNLDDFGRLTNIEQQIGGHRTELAIAQFIHHVQNADIHEYYGQSELREAYRAWYSKDVTILLQNIYLERAAGGFVVATPTQGTTLTTKSAEYQAIVNLLGDLRSSSAFLLPSNIDLEVHMPNDTQVFERAIQGHDKAISKALLMPNLLGLGETGPNGSRALGDTQLEAFLWMLDAEAKNLEEVMNEQLFQDLAHQNFPDGLYPRFEFHELSDKKVMEVVDKWTALVTGNAVKPNSQDEAHIRNVLDFPEQEEDDSESIPVDPQTALSGIQVTSMMEVVDRVALEKIPRETGINILIASFPINADTAEAIMGEVGKGFIPKSQAPALPAPGQPVIPGEPLEPQPEPTPGPDEETIRALGGSDRIEAQLAAAKNRVAFAVIDKKSLEIEKESITTLSTAVMGAVIPLTDNVLTMKVIQADDLKDLKFKKNDIRKIQNQVKKMLLAGWSLGMKHAKDEVRQAGKSPDVDFARLDTDAGVFFDNKSFTVTGKLTNDMLTDIQNILSQSIKNSDATRATVDQIYQTFSNKGYIINDDAQDAMAGILETTSDAQTAARLNTIVRTNTFEAINEARYSYFTDAALDGFVEAMEYSAILDQRTTAICRHLDGKTFGSEGEIWEGGFRPPNHFNCRSILIPITQIDKWSESQPPEVFPQEGFG